MAKVLIVDDEKSIRITLARFLRADGHTVTVAEDATEALRLLRAEPCDVLLTDIILPAVTGVELLRQVRQEKPETLVIMMTGEPSLETAVEAVRAGAYDYLAKPIGKEAVLQVVARALQIKELQDAKRRLEQANREYQAGLERMVAERTAALAQTEARFRGLVETTLDWVWELDPEGRYTYASPRVEALLGYLPAEVLGRTPFDFMAAADAGQARAFFAHLVAGRERFSMLERVCRHRDGRVVVLESSGMPVLGPGEVLLGYRGMDRDVTDRKRASETVRKLARAIEQSPVSIMITDLAGNIEFVNPKFTQVTGYSAAEAVGKNPRILKSGELAPEAYARMWDTISHGGVWRGEFHNQRKTGELYWEDASISPITDEAGVITHYLAVKEDITARKVAEAERIKLQAQFNQAQKMESVGRLAGGVAHDFNNMLGAIMGNVALALEVLPPDAPARENLEEIEKCAQRSADLTRQLLAFARKQNVAPCVLDLNATVSGMLRLLRRLIGEDIELTWVPGANLWPVKADPSQIDQVLANLCVNSRDAITGVGTVIIETENVVLDQAYVAGHPELVPGKFVRLAVSDNGCGMDKAVREQMFEPFFTTKGVGRGTGLGLATVYGAVQQSRGHILVYSEVGRGTTFKIYLPRHVETAKPVAAMPAELPAEGGQETILLVEDEPVILTVVRRSLESLGYTVLAAGSPHEALRLAAEYAGRLHLVVTDVVMPEMNGRELATKLLARYPGLKCLFMSGYTANVIANTGILGEPIHFLQKPFTIPSLASKVREALKG